MLQKIDRVVDCSDIDIEAYDSKNNPMLLPKAIIVACLESEAKQYDGRGTSFEKKLKKEVKNLSYFI